MYLQRYYRSDDGLRLFARDYPGPGPGSPCVLCLPGLTRNSRDFVRLAGALRTRYRVLCPDLRGRGHSQRDPEPARYRPDRYVADMFGMLDLLGVAQCDVIGTSLGGLMAIIMSAMQPARVRSLVLNDVGPELDPRGVARIQGYMNKPVEPGGLDEALARLQAINAGNFPDFSPADWLDMVMATHVMEELIAVPDFDPAIAQGLNSGSAAPTLWPLFDAIKGKPALVLRGEHSDILSAATVAAMCERLPGLQAVEIAGRGHAPTLDEPAARAAIQSLLEGAQA